MSQIQNQNPGSTEIQSPLIAGITEALNKISSVLSMNVGSLSDAQLTPVSIDESPDNQRRIYEAPQGSRLWLSEPVPVFKINGSVITQEQYSFSIDYVGGSITFTTSKKPSASDKVTVTASYIINQSKFVNDINSAVSDLEEKSSRYKGSFEDKDDLILAYPSGENGDFAILFSPFAVYAWKNDGWYDTRSIEDLSDYYKKSEVNNLLNQKEPTIQPKGNSASDDNYYWGGRKTWQDLFAKVRSVTLTGLSTATSTAVTATDTVLSSIGKLQGQVNKIISDGFGFKSFSKAVFPEDETGNIDPTSPMLMSSLTATSAADRLDHVVIPGKTVQAGSGDPSPENQRPIKGIGRRMVKLVLDSSLAWSKSTSPQISPYFGATIAIAPNSGENMEIAQANQFCTAASINNADGNSDEVAWAFASGGQSYVRARIGNAQSAEEFGALLDSRKNSGNPVVLYYVPADESQATGWYTWEAVDGAEYAAVGLPLNGPLYDGDKVSNNEPSGCDAAVTFDGSEDESWGQMETATSGKYRYNIALPNAVPADTDSGVAYCDMLPLIPAGETWNNRAGFTVTSGRLNLYHNGESVTEWKAFLRENPITFLYRTTSYTQKNDIRAEIETHGDILYTLTGEEVYTATGEGWMPGTVSISNFMVYAKPVEGYASKASIVCSHLATETPANVTNRGYQGCAQGGGTSLYLNFGDPYNTKELAVQYIKDQYAAGTPVQIKAKRATPIIYAHPRQPLANPAGTWTLSAENTPQGYMRPLTDADRADYADQAKEADNADQLGGQKPTWYMPTGAVIPFAGKAAPAGWLLCDGSLISRTTYAALFAAIGTAYGEGDGKSTFALPNLQGRVAAGTSSSHPLASKAGADSKQITRANLPAEKLKIADNGSWLVDTTQFGVHTGKPLTLGAGRIDAEYLYTEPLGSGTAFDVRQATLYLNYIIKY